MVTKTLQENEDLCHHLSQEILLQSRFQVYMSFKLGKTKLISCSDWLVRKKDLNW
jgi:hypothetical protein